MPADLIVGIDFGMTYTGVAFFVPDKTDPDRAKLLQKWPGKEDKTENKVPTALVYHGKKLKSWGFLCDRPGQDDHPDPRRQQYFKLWLDKSHLDQVFPEHDGPSHEDVKKWYTDFLKRLYLHIKQTFSDGPHGEEWESKVDFVFSVPTTWKSQDVFDTYRQCIQDAGFGKKGKKHKFHIGLTEAEAAAIHTFNSQALKFEPRDMILVCDAGGGTTDAALLETLESSGDVPQLRQFGVDCGKPVGSVNIDDSFRNLVTDRLKTAVIAYPALADDDPQWAEDTASAMTRGDFQYYKCAFGTTEGTHEKFRIRIPDFPSSKNFPDAFIEKKHMLFTRRDMSKLFDDQLVGIYSILDDQLAHLKKMKKQLKYLVLSGGLGSSTYVKNKLKDRYVNNNKVYPCAKHLKIYTADDPQTAVVQGLVVNHAQQREYGVPVLKSRTSPASYGVLCQEPYDKEKHVGCEMERDELDGKWYAVNLVRWFVKRGDLVSENKDVSYTFKRKFSPNTKPQRNRWNSSIVISWKDRKYLPKCLDEDVMTLCTIQSDTSSLELRDFEKVWPWYDPLGVGGVLYYTAMYEVKVTIEVANILFEVWCNDVKLSKDEPIQVRWEEGAKGARPEDVGKAKDTFVR